MDLGLSLTGLALIACLVRSAILQREPALPCVLFAIWTASLALWAADARMATFVFSAALLNLAVAGVALAVTLRDPARLEARVTGGLSMAIMPSHWVMSVTNGGVDWTLYAWSCNIVYILQCLVAGGWLDGLGRRLAGIFGRTGAVRRLRSGGG